jgi:hypothetical protein
MPRVKTQPFLTSTHSLTDGLELVRRAINDNDVRADALRILQEWLDAILLLSTEFVEPVIADALGHVAAIQQALASAATAQPEMKSRERRKLCARIEPLRRRLLQLEGAMRPQRKLADLAS